VSVWPSLVGVGITIISRCWYPMIIIPTPTNDRYSNTYQWSLYQHLPMIVIATPTNDRYTDTYLFFLFVSSIVRNLHSWKSPYITTWHGCTRIYNIIIKIVKLFIKYVEELISSLKSYLGLNVHETIHV
jgi:hypothetical protein